VLHRVRCGGGVDLSTIVGGIDAPG